MCVIWLPVISGSPEKGSWKRQLRLLTIIMMAINNFSIMSESFLSNISVLLFLDQGSDALKRKLPSYTFGQLFMSNNLLPAAP